MRSGSAERIAIKSSVVSFRCQLPKGRQAQRRFRAGALEQRVLQCLRQ